MAALLVCAFSSAPPLSSLPGNWGTEWQQVFKQLMACCCAQHGMVSDMAPGALLSEALMFAVRWQTCVAAPTSPLTGHAQASEGATSERIASRANNTNWGRRHLAIIVLYGSYLREHGTP